MSLKQSAENYLLGEDKVINYLDQLNLKSKVVEKIFFEFVLISKKAGKGLEEHLRKKQYSDEKMLEEIEGYKKYINAISFLIVAYCGNQGTEIVREKLSTTWDTFLKPLVTSYEEVYNKLLTYNLYPKEFRKNCFKWNFLTDTYVTNINSLEDYVTNRVITEGQQLKKVEYETISKGLIDEIKNVNLCRDFYLKETNVNVQECSVNVFDSLRKRNTYCLTGLKILKDFNQQTIEVFESQEQLKDLLSDLHTTVTKYNYITPGTMVYFEEDRQERLLYRLNITGGNNQALFKYTKKDDNLFEKISDEKLQKAYARSFS